MTLTASSLPVTHRSCVTRVVLLSWVVVALLFYWVAAVVTPCQNCIALCCVVESLQCEELNLLFGYRYKTPRVFCKCPGDILRILKAKLWRWAMLVATVLWQKRLCSSFSRLFSMFYVSCFPLLLAGSEDGKIHVWNGESGMKVAVLDGKHTGPITCLQFNPKFMTFASACSNMVRKEV